MPIREVYPHRRNFPTSGNIGITKRMQPNPFEKDGSQTAVRTRGMQGYRSRRSAPHARS